MKKPFETEMDDTRQAVGQIVGLCTTIALHQEFGVGKTRLERIKARIDELENQNTEVIMTPDAYGRPSKDKAEAIRESWLAGYVSSDYRIPMVRLPRGRKEQQYRIAGDRAAKIAWQVYAKAVIDVLHYGPDRLERLRKESHAEDPDEGEVPYTYLVLENEPEWIRPASSIVGKLATIDLIAAVGDVDTVTAAIDPEAIATVAAVNDLLQRHNEDPEAHVGIIMDAVGSAMKKLEESGQIMSEDRVKELINESGDGGGAAIIKDITIPADGWDWQRESGDEETLGMDDFRCVVNVAVDDATEDVFPSVALHKAALEVAKRAGLCPTVQALAGVLRFWARNIPTEDMSATVALFAPGGTTGGGSAYVLPVATANRLGGVKIGSGISVTADGTVTVSTSGITPEEVVSAADTDKMLDEIFPSES